MKLIARGWARDHGGKILVNADLYDKRPRRSIRIDDLALNTDELGEVDIWWGKGPLRFTGDYFFSLVLNRKDVARLFVEAFGESDLKTVLDLLEGARQEKAQ